MSGQYRHPVNGNVVKEYTCMECGTPLDYQFGVCGRCVLRIGRACASDQVQDAKNIRERGNWFQRRREQGLTLSNDGRVYCDHPDCQGLYLPHTH